MDNLIPAEPDVSRVFISYSRKDSVFAYKIADALEKTGIETLIDKDDIEKLEPWWERITALIDQANTVIFIISPDWLVSEICEKELEYAIHSSKKLSPVIYQQPNGEKLPDALAKLNWIYFTPDGNFADWINDLRQILLKDIGWIREHTRLGEAALFWIKHNRQNSDLLRAASLLTAERWLSQKPPDAPSPSGALMDFLKISREVWEEEERENKKMIEGVMISQSKLLAERSRQLLASGDAVTGILLSLEGLPDPAFGNSRPLVREAEVACYNALSLRREEQVIRTEYKTPAFAMTKDGTVLLTGSVTQTDVWDVKTGKLKKRIDGVFSAFSANGMYIVSVNKEHQISVWDAEQLSSISTWDGMASGIESADIDEEHALIAVLSKDQTVRIWEWRSGTEILTLKTDTPYAANISLLPDGQHLLVAGKNIKLINITSGKEVVDVEAEYEKVAISMQSHKIATTARYTIGMPTDVQLWDSQTGKLNYTLSGHGSYVSSVVFSPDGKLVATTSSDRTARIWDVATGKMVQLLRGHDDSVAGACFDKTGALLVTASFDNSFIVWDVSTGELVTVLKGHFGNVHKSWSFTFWKPNAIFSFKNDKVITSWNDETVRIWSLIPIGMGQALEAHQAKLTGVFFHPGGHCFATSSEDKTIIVWDLANRDIIKIITGMNDEVNDVAFSPDGKLLAGISDDMVYLWETSSYKEVRQIKQKEDDANNRRVRFSPDGSQLLVIDIDIVSSNAAIFDLRSGELQYNIETDAWIYSGEFSPNGRFIATTGDERAVRFWNASTGKEAFHVLPGHTSSVYQVSFNRSGTRIVVALDNLYATIWTLGTDISEPGSLVQLTGHDKEVLYAEFSPDEKQVVTASSDHKIRIFDSITGELISVLEGHSGPVTKAIYSPNGEQIVSISGDNQIRVWNLFSTAEALVDYAKKTVPRLLTSDQRRDLHLDVELPKWYLGSGKWPFYQYFPLR